MVDFAMDIHSQLYPDQPIPSDLPERRSKVVSELKKLQDEVDPILKIFQNPAVLNQLQSSRDPKASVAYLQENHEFHPEMLDTLYNFSKFQYEIGNYTGCSDYLYLYRGLVPSTDKNYLSALWGKLASEILTQNWDNALDDLNRLKEVIDSGVISSPLHALQQRTWLIHWSLFVFFNHTKGNSFSTRNKFY